MCTFEEISLKDFENDVSQTSEFVVDINALLQVCGASPICVHYKTDKIIVITTFPERIVLKSGDSYINLSQIKRITKQKSGAKCVYELLCGVLEGLETTIKLSRS